jgi:hypothetical protein
VNPCINCGHHPHPGRACIVEKVTGPAVDNELVTLSQAGQHKGRTVTPCECKVYGYVNGVPA